MTKFNDYGSNSPSRWGGTAALSFPEKAGIQSVMFFLDTRLRGCDGCNHSTDTSQLAAG